MSDLGLYIHVPFCLSKCPYCDFYSVRYSREKACAYADAVIRNIKAYGERYDTVYFGGGTPILLYEHIPEILGAADVAAGSEITVEANPCVITEKTVEALANAGVGRVSLGVQSMNKRELEFLGRRHTPEQVGIAFELLRKAGITNVSADVMIALPDQDEESIHGTVTALSDLGAMHISAYILKVEENTPFYGKFGDEPPVSDDTAARLYLYTVGELERLGYVQYEISNFAVPGYESRHNLKYWRCEEYIGIGAAAHSYHNGKRFCVRPDIDGFINMPVQQTTVTDENAGGWEEYAMLKLRLTEGLTFAEAERFGRADELCENAGKLPKNLVIITPEWVALTPEGFVVSNTVIEKMIF